MILIGHYVIVYSKENQIQQWPRLGLGLPGVRKWTGQSGNQRHCPENKSTH